MGDVELFDTNCYSFGVMAGNESLPETFYDDEGEESPPGDPSEPIVRLNVTIMFLSGSSFRFEANESTLVSDLKRDIRKNPDFDVAGKSIRLIALGRILDDNATLSDSGLSDGSVIHCMLADDVSGQPSVDQQPTAPAAPARPFVHFRDVPADEDEYVIGSEGTWRDFAFGFLMGSFLGILVLICMVDSSLPRKYKLGLFAGVLVNTGFDLIQALSTRSVVSQGEDAAG